MLYEDKLRDASLLVYANKQDSPNAMTPEEIVDIFDCHELMRKWHVFGSCAGSGDGLYEGLDWLFSVLRNNSDPKVACGPDFWSKPRRVEWPGKYVVEQTLDLWDKLPWCNPVSHVQSQPSSRRIKVADLEKGEVIEVVEVLRDPTRTGLTHCRIKREDDIPSVWAEVRANSLSFPTFW